MTDALQRGRSHERAGAAYYRVHQEHDPRVVEAELSADRAYAAYALGHLEPGLIESARFWIAEGPSGRGLVMHAKAMGRTVVVSGAPAAVGAILSLHPGARAAYLSTAAPEHLRAIRRSLVVYDMLEMMRMSATPASFRPRPGAVRRLTGHEVGRVNRLYAMEGGPSHYTPEAIERAVYYGAFDGTRLVAVAGTHIVAPNQALGIVGNVFTDPAYRGLGLATQVTSAVTEELFQLGCSEATLTVDPGNTPAVRAYARLGYERGAAVVEARLSRRDILGAGPALRRMLARRRSEEIGIELIPARGGHWKDG